MRIYECILDGTIYIGIWPDICDRVENWQNNSVNSVKVGQKSKQMNRPYTE